MTLPKALLCVLDEHPSAQPPEEAALRAVGFAAATVPWRQISAQRGWMQLLPILDDPAVQAWVFCGASTDFTPAVLNRMAMLTLALHRPSPPLTACLLTGDGPEPELPHWLGDVRVFRRDKQLSFYVQIDLFRVIIFYISICYIKTVIQRSPEIAPCIPLFSGYYSGYPYKLAF